jgi:hypothetical protein
VVGPWTHRQIQNSNFKCGLQIPQAIVFPRTGNSGLENFRPGLFFEEILELLPCIAGARSAFRRGRRACHGGRGRGIFFDGGAKFVERAIVPLIFLRDPLGNGLHAFESRGRIEIRALFAGVQFEAAARTLALGVEPRLQDCTAIRTPGAGDGADHARRTRPDLILSWVAFRRTFLFFLGLVRTHIAPLLIFPLQ